MSSPSQPSGLPNQPPLSLCISLSRNLRSCPQFSLSLLLGSPISVLNTASKRNPSYGSFAPSRSSRMPRLLNHILLFNCMEVNSCASSGNHSSKAIFVPSMSTYNKVTSGASIIPSDIPSRDLSWQLNFQRTWEQIIHGNGNLLGSIAS
ncbi:folylpolyglutamate synthase-like [Actinidia eriantha]|uniref:folylpolyglutamate synthase-like n=1 Tax=Actinidia eriantha TaxID=165200 RepID=UPI0025887D1F|nr:folylpolyglutamate synthase-like [Actinidia eriantha]